jgi:RES domain-containing protein
MLEFAAHGIKANVDYCLAEIDIPEEKIFSIDKSALPKDWFNIPSPEKLKNIGDKFVSDMNYLAIKVPSVVNQKEFNFLINPQHPDFIKVKIISTEQLIIDQRLG